MLNIDPIVRVNVNVGTSTASAGVFDVGAILGSTAVAGFFDETHRFKEYANIADMVTDGFLTTSAEYKAAEKYFNVEPAPSKVVMIFYHSNPVSADNAQEYSPTATYNVGEYCKHTADEVTKTYVCNTQISTAHAWNESEWDELPENETPAYAAVDAINSGAEFYAAYYIPKTSESSANIKTYITGLASMMDAMNRGVVFYGVTGSADIASGDDGLFASMKNIGANRAIGMLCTTSEDDAAGLMGEAMGLSKAHPDTPFALCYKTVGSIVPNSITQTQVEKVKEVNGNVYVQRTRARAFVENGACASGLRFDDVLYIDRMTYEIQNTIYELIADSDEKLPQVDSTSTIFINAIRRVLDSYYDMGVLATNPWRGSDIDGVIENGDIVEHGHAEYVDSFDVQSTADRNARKAMPITILLCLSGSVESIVITVDVQT